MRFAEFTRAAPWDLGLDPVTMCDACRYLSSLSPGRSIAVASLPSSPAPISSVLRHRRMRPGSPSDRASGRPLRGDWIGAVWGPALRGDASRRRARQVWRRARYRGQGESDERGLLCTNTPDVLPQSVAELTMVMIGAAARNLCAMTADMRNGEWTLRQGVDLHGKTLAIVGCGAIGRAAARIASVGFGMRVLGYARRPAADITRDGHFELVSDDFAAVVRDADFVSLHIPGSPENARFIDQARLALFAERAWLINTARGAVVDEAALYDALVEKRLAGAALDVFEREPYQPVDPTRDLRTLPQMILLPHVGSHTAEANCRMAERALRNIRLAEAGDFAAMDLLNRERALWPVTAR